MALDGRGGVCGGLGLHRLTAQFDGRAILARPLSIAFNELFDAVELRLTRAVANMTANELQSRLAGDLAPTLQHPTEEALCPTPRSAREPAWHEQSGCAVR